MRVEKCLKICTLTCYFCRKYIVCTKKSTAELCVVTLKNDAKFDKELTCALKNDIRNMTQHFKVSKLAL